MNNATVKMRETSKHFQAAVKKLAAASTTATQAIWSFVDAVSRLKVKQLK